MSSLDQLLSKHHTIIDGGLSNVLEAKGCDLNHPLWTAKLLTDDPESIVATHLDYIKAGAQIISTASYQASFPGLSLLGLTKEGAKSLLLKSVSLAQEAIARATNDELIQECPLIAASIGPYGAYLADGAEYRGDYGITYEALADFHRERIDVFEESAADLLAFETIPSFEEAEVLAQLLKGVKKPAWVSFSCQDEQHLNDGTPLQKAVKLFDAHPSVFALGVNCTHPQYISGLIQVIKQHSNKQVLVYPNSGEVYDATSKTWKALSAPLDFGEMAQTWIKEGANMIGGCCRIGPAHIQQLSSARI
jgi:homocysteine S-methyltransferase